ncbi:HupE/UreJ family protein [Roseomonas sp. SSH11]|uniref:HupE/UreJ family protein n=1 Tax=Pararoseomonas baculiformis TaxID=2820812 RepID=A0ABS4AMJ0_9PROT|nr:HupE/UreJ family protein [Pararoseomonas baculiformis]MBP0447775.1 HupE/UreJ family protein [Pararoseomonas baculiformis]
MRRLLLTALALLPLPALAHTGGDHALGFTTGLAHPLGGADHAVAMLAVGLWAGLLGGRAMLALPAAFLAAMLAGFGLGAAGVALPMVEGGIVASVVVLGGAVALAKRPHLAFLLGLVALFGLFHGHAHGTEMGEGSGALAYATGFLAASAALHGAGLALVRLLLPQLLARSAGAAMAVFGLILLV